MAKVPLTLGAYSAKGLVAEAQRCINLYAEKNPGDSPFPFTNYITPGLTLLAAATPFSGSGWRGIYYASNNQLYGVCGDTLYAIDSNWNLTSLGVLPSASGVVSMVDNANFLVIVDGSAEGWTVDLTDNTFSPITAAAFAGGNNVQFMDGYLILNVPGSQQWYISVANEINFDATMFASKTGFSDKLIGLQVAKRYIYLLGAETTEIWFDAGDTPFPMDRLPGTFIQHGCASANSIASMDGEIYWLSQSPQGHAIVCKTQGFNASQISTFAIDNEIQDYPDLHKAIGFVYQFEGHFFYVLTFPDSDVTWQFDLSTRQWNQLAWCDNNGNLHRHRANCYALAYDSPVVGDWENGNLYLWDKNAFTDNGQPIARIRSFPHGVDDSCNRIIYQEFIANFEVGQGAGAGAPTPVFLRWSDTRGYSWGNAVQRSLGLEGEYLTSVQWRRLGMARDRVFELSWSAPCKTALLGAWVDARSNNQ